jgi:hypothetical protein
MDYAACQRDRSKVGENRLVRNMPVLEPVTVQKFQQLVFGRDHIPNYILTEIKNSP